MSSTKRQIPMYSGEYFMMCAIGGVFSCGITHTAVTPLDLVKCNAQVNPKEFPGALAGIRSIYTGKVSHLGFGSGLVGLTKGWGPTLVGYSVQGAAKFGFYEYFKHISAEAVGEENAHKYKSLIYAGSSAAAEVIADLGLCPFEAVKVRVQTNPSFARGMSDGLPKIIQSEGLGNLYAGLVPLWARQVPYTIMKFVAFERIAEAIYAALPIKKEDMSKTQQLGVVFGAGYLAGILCGVVSHPADTLVSKINKLKMDGSLGQKVDFILKGTAEHPGIGYGGLWAGLVPRVVMIGTLTGLQWFIYGAFKGAVGLPTPGASSNEQKKH